MSLAKAIWKQLARARAWFRPVSNWRQAWRLNTVQAAAALAFLSAVQADLLPIVQAVVPPAWWPYVTGAIALAIILLRLRDQPGVDVGRVPADKSVGGDPQ
ncbi:hypothetical protein [Variovorax atrisoli]|uniref:DUF7940 domain-containing protein n=1 Tax=Variovorax atrisoli TaxID=3394203 RepID=UPI00339B5B60